jgi:hypothetical protein
MAYWKQHLAGAPALLNFPTDRPRPAAQKFQGETQTLVLSGALAESLKILSRRQGATLFMTLLAAFKTLLFRYSGLTDIAGRRHQQHRDHVPRVATAYWSEREQLLVEWNDTAALKETSLCVHQLFEQHARTTPNAIAVFSEDQTLTYGITERTGRRSGLSTAPARLWTGKHRGYQHRPVTRDVCRRAGRAQGGWRLPATRSTLPE